LNCLKTLAFVESSETYTEQCRNIAFEALIVMNYGMEEITAVYESDMDDD
jgi:hypothetical protein